MISSGINDPARIRAGSLIPELIISVVGLKPDMLVDTRSVAG